MGSQLIEDDKNERIIRGILKQPFNRKCINCNNLGPQYVCTTFSTFVCTTCSGIHREFTHRVKSISMAKFTPQEVASLQAGGNEHAREIYFKEWDSQRHFAPDCSNVDRLRNFIKHVYVDKRYTSERSIDRPPQGYKEELIENRPDGYQSDSRSPPYDEIYEHHNSGRANPVHSGVINGWWHEDRFTNGMKSEDHPNSDGELKSGIVSPDHQKDSSSPSSPGGRPVREILEDNVTPLRISEPPKSYSSKISAAPTITQRTTSSGSLASSNGNPSEIKREASLIDFDVDPEPPLTAAAAHSKQSTVSQSIGWSTSASNDDNWACFDDEPENKVSQAPTKSNSLGSLFTQLSVPASAPVSGSTTSSAIPTPSNDLLSTTAIHVAPVELSPISSLSFDPCRGAASIPGLSPTSPLNGGAGHCNGSSMQHHQLPLSHGGAPQLPSSYQGVTGNHAAQALQKQVLVNSAAEMVEVKSSGRKELPTDLFTAMYSSDPYQAPGWQAGLNPGMGHHVQFNPPMAMPSILQPSKSSNPFDVNAEASPFPSMSSFHAALPNNHGPTMSSWMPPLQSSSYSSTVPPFIAQSFGSVIPNARYMSEQPPTSMAAASRAQGFGCEGTTAFGSWNPAAASPNPSHGGNPFS